MADDEKIPWYSWLILAFHLIWNFLIIWMTKAEVFSDTLRWGVTIAFILATAGFGAYDHFFDKDTEGRDQKPCDKWTIIHTLAGVVFGLWYVPLVYVVITVLWWEVFEATVKGFGDKEVILNRVVDMGVALGGWLLMVVAALIFLGASFPLANPVSK